MSRTQKGTSKFVARTDRGVRTLKKVLQRQARHALNAESQRPEPLLNDPKRTHNFLRGWL